jgi:hypothetical protein
LALATVSPNFWNRVYEDAALAPISGPPGRGPEWRSSHVDRGYLAVPHVLFHGIREHSRTAVNVMA